MNIKKFDNYYKFVFKQHKEKRNKTSFGTKPQSFWGPLALFSDSQLEFLELFMKPLPS